MDSSKRNVVELIIRIIAIICLCAFLWFIFVGIRTAIKYRSTVNSFKDTVSVVPVEESWPALDTGSEISLSYLSFHLPTEQIALINNPLEATVQVVLNTGMVLVILPPITTQRQVTDAAAPDFSPMDFDWQKSICHVQPVGTFKFLRLDDESRTKHYKQIVKKGSNPFNYQGMVIFDAPQVQGILHRGDPQQSKMVCEIWSKNKNFYQAIAIASPEKGLTAQQESLAKTIIASIEYKIDSLPDITELQNNLLESIKSAPGFVETQEPQIEEQPTQEPQTQEQP